MSTDRFERSQLATTSQQVASKSNCTSYHFDSQNYELFLQQDDTSHIEKFTSTSTGIVTTALPSQLLNDEASKKEGRHTRQRTRSILNSISEASLKLRNKIVLPIDGSDFISTTRLEGRLVECQDGTVVVEADTSLQSSTSGADISSSTQGVTSAENGEQRTSSNQCTVESISERVENETKLSKFLKVIKESFKHPEAPTRPLQLTSIINQSTVLPKEVFPVNYLSYGDPSDEQARILQSSYGTCPIPTMSLAATIASQEEANIEQRASLSSGLLKRISLKKKGKEKCTHSNVSPQEIDTVPAPPYSVN